MDLLDIIYGQKNKYYEELQKFCDIYNDAIENNKPYKIRLVIKFQHTYWNVWSSGRISKNPTTSNHSFEVDYQSSKENIRHNTNVLFLDAKNINQLINKIANKIQEGLVSELQVKNTLQS